jgi:cytochrome c oxidase subunit 2
VLGAGFGLLCTGCHGPRAILSPASREARVVENLWWLYLGVAGAVLGVVLLFLLGAIRRAQRQRASADGPAAAILEPTAATERRLTRVVGSATAVTIGLLLVLLVADFAAGRTLGPSSVPGPLTIRITGRQWWWELEYDDPAPANTIRTANELHLPRGRPVQLILRSSDVIHSFWLPNLQGKRDLIPGKTQTLWFTPDRLGEFRGQCAEFCGYQHAHMRLVAVVESPEDFARWQEAQRRPAPEPVTDSQRRGRDVFLQTSCVLCHTIAGTVAASRVGPPLTHLASQITLGAGSFPNTRGHLAGWILDPQAMKPGVRMPQNPLGADELYALLDYLGTLK